MESLAQNEIAIKTIKNHYQFAGDDARILRELKPLLVDHSDAFVRELYVFIFNFDQAKVFLKNDNVIGSHQKQIKDWFIHLASGDYDELYFQRLYVISEIHVRIGLSTHYINACFNFIRRFIVDLLVANKQEEGITVFEKILDINLDILTRAYHYENTKHMVSIINKIRKALRRSSIVPYYQPIVSNADGSLFKYECLARIVEKDGSTVPPMEFIPVAKRVRMYPDITIEIIQHAFRDHVKLNKPFGINLSMEDIRNEKINDLIFKLLEKDTGIGNHLTFEILESEKIDDYTEINAFIYKVKEYGVKLAIDDFGSGFSNFGYVTKIDVDYLKIDGSLIKELHKRKENRAAVNAIVRLAEKLKMETIAEFVSDLEVFEAVKKAGITYSQGYHLGKPEPVSHYL